MKANRLFKTFLTAGLVATTLLTGCSSEGSTSSEPVKIGIPSDATTGGEAAAPTIIKVVGVGGGGGNAVIIGQKVLQNPVFAILSYPLQKARFAADDFLKACCLHFIFI